LTVTVTKAGYSITNSSKSITIYYKSDGSTFNNTSGLQTYFNNLPANDRNNPYIIKYNGTLGGDPLTTGSLGYIIRQNITKYVTIDLSGSTMTVIEANAFSGCSNLVSIIIPQGITTIGGSAFAETGITSVTIPASVTTIGTYAFSAGYLTEIIVNPLNTQYSSLNGVLYNKTQTELVCYPRGKTSSSFTIPDTVEVISTGAFSNCSNLTNIIIGNSVREIGIGAFFESTNITSIIIPDNVTSIGNFAFAGCANLTSVTFEGTIASGNIDSFTFYGDLRAKFYVTDAANGTAGTYTTTAPVGSSSVWTKQG